MNKDINLTELIEIEKEAFLSSFENEEHFITENTRSYSGGIGFFTFSFLLSTLSALISRSPQFFFTDSFDHHSYLSTVLDLFSVALFFTFLTCQLLKEENLLRFWFKRMFKKKSAKEIYEHTKKNHLIDFHILPISDKIHNIVKVNFSMDEYKHLLSFGSNNKISYGQLLEFIENRERYKKERQAIEEAKNSVHLSPSEIKAYQKEHLS